MMGDYPLMVNGFTGPEQPREQDAADRHRSPTTPSASATASSCTRTRPTTSSPISRASSCQRAVRLGRARHDAEGACRSAAGRPITIQLSARSPEVGTHQSAGKEDRRACRLRAVRRAAAVPRFRPQDLRRRRDQGCRPSMASSCARTSPRNIPRVVVGLHQGVDGGQRLGARQSQARRREDRGVDQHQQGSRLHLPRAGRHAHARSDHQAAVGRRRSEDDYGDAAEAEHDQGIRCQTPGSTTSYVRQAFKEHGLDYDKQLRLVRDLRRHRATIRSAMRRSTTRGRPARSGSRAATSCRSARRPARCWA